MTTIIQGRKLIAKIAGYEIKTGGFRGVHLNCITKVRAQSDVLETIEAARFWAKNEAHKAYEEQGYTLASLKVRGEYQANVWVAA